MTRGVSSRPSRRRADPGEFSAYLTQYTGRAAPKGTALTETLSGLSGDDVTVFRVASLFGVRGASGKGGNFVETMLRVAAQGKQLKVVNDQRCTPSYTADVAAAIAGLIGAGVLGMQESLQMREALA